MIDEIKKLDAEKAKRILEDIMEVYLDKGFGLMNKTEIETLFYYVFKKYGLLEGKCYPDSFKLKITEAKARKLLYESQVKYGTHDSDEMERVLREAVGEYLTHAYFSKNNKEIRFAIEDKFIRIALHAKLRANNYFADTSFNSDIVSLDEGALTELVLLLVPNDLKDDALKRINKVIKSDKKNADEVKSYAKEVVKGAFKSVAIDKIKELGPTLIALASSV